MISHTSELADLRMQNLTRAVQSIMLFAAAIFANAFLPQLIITYMYTQEELLTLTEQPMILEVLPVVTFAIAAGYFVYTVFANMMNNKNAKVLKQELALGGGCCDGNCSCGEEDLSDAELKELEAIVEEALKPAKKSKSASAAKKPAKKKTAKKPAKKSAKK
ncbi:MAG: hypothetical protein H6773_01280 [Pseudomonadales bacterium]|nr:hypothetical protein [Candidatus Woesebacteria bacterium]MCB9800788.1 hypothetical protein [Pseudomonadales bacterium]